MTKISVIGAGVQGSVIVSILAGLKEVSEIVCSDINLERAKRAMERIKSDKVRARKANAENPDELLEVVRGTRAVVNATLPKFNLSVMDAVLKSGAYYQRVTQQSCQKISSEG